MARPPRFKIPAIADLLRQLSFAPGGTLQRQMEAAESFVGEIDPRQVYPEDFVIYRITAYRPDISDPVMFVGEALLADLVTFVERLSDRLALTADQYAPRVPVPAREVLRRLRIAHSTLHRYRQQGLVAHQVVGPDGRKRLAYLEDSIERFIARRRDQIERAGRFTRVDDATRERILRRAGRYRQSLGLSLNESAKRLAQRFGRSAEAIRQILQRYDRDHDEAPIFANQGPMTARQRRLVFGAYQAAIPIRLIAVRLKRSRNSIYRTIHEQRAQTIQSWPVKPTVLPTFELEDADSVLLSPRVVNRDLVDSSCLTGFAVEWIKQAQTTELPDKSTELAMIGAVNYLLFFISRLRGELSRFNPRARDLDLIETRLRWAFRLKIRIMASLQHSVLATLDIHLGRRLATRPAAEIRALHKLAQSVLANAVDRFDPTSGQRLEAYATFLLGRELAKLPGLSSIGAASARHGRRTIELHDPRYDLYPWVRQLELERRLELHRDQLGAESYRVLSARLGWDGRAPQTHEQIGLRLCRPPERVAAIEYRALRALRSFARTSSD